MKRWRNIKKYFFLPLVLLSFSIIPFVFSCSYSNQIDQKLKSNFVNWYNSLTKQKFNNSNFHCESEAQAIILYANWRGHFWNESLHKQQEPSNYILQNKEIRGNDYKKMEDGLNKATFPYDYKVFHGVEYQEIEFYDQLKNFMDKNADGSYSYDRCIGQDIYSYGFLSTSVSRTEALEYCDGYVFNDMNKPWGEGEFFLPLKEEVLFEINIPKNYKGAAYLADFNFVGYVNPDNQVLINRNCKLHINDVKKEKHNGKIINIFDLDLLMN